MLWSFEAQTGIGAGPISYEVGDTQYVAVMSGYGGAWGLAGGLPDGPQRIQPNGRMLVFKLGGTGTLPHYVSPELAPPNPPSESFTPQQIGLGKDIYEGNCGICHGGGARSSGLVPDLRRSAALAEKALWSEVVHGGLLREQGMVSFAKWFSKDEIEAVRAYVGEQAKFLATDEGAKLAAQGSLKQ